LSWAAYDTMSDAQQGLPPDCLQRALRSRFRQQVKPVLGFPQSFLFVLLVSAGDIRRIPVSYGYRQIGGFETARGERHFARMSIEKRPGWCGLWSEFILLPAISGAILRRRAFLTP